MTIKEHIKPDILAMSELGYSNVKIGQLHGINESTVRKIKKEYKDQQEKNLPIVPAKMRQITDIKEKFSQKCEHTLDRIISGISDIDIEKANLRDKAISFGIFFDKMALASNMATQNIDHKHSLVGSIRSSTAEN